MKYWSLCKSMMGSSDIGPISNFESRMSNLIGGAGLFQQPLVPAVRMTTAGGREEAAAMTPEQRPDLLQVGLGHLQGGQHGAREKLEHAFTVRRRERLQLRL